MAGYLWQAVEACRRGLTASSDSIIKIEVEDDLSVATLDGSILSCEQLKHSEANNAISEESPLWWQAIDAWIRGSTPETARLRLLTTSPMKLDSLLASCYQPTRLPPWDALLVEMDRQARNVRNKALASKGVYRRWLELNGGRRQLLTRVEIASSQGRLEVTSEQLEGTLMDRGVAPDIVAGVRESLVGAFMSRLTSSLDSGGFEITAHEMNADFLEAYSRHATPGEYEFSDLDYTSKDIETLRTEHHQHLIPQLAAIRKDQSSTVARALDNWFRARTRRQAFMDGNPHEVKDLLDHDDHLTQFCLTLHEEHTPVENAEIAQEVGRAVHANCMRHQANLGRTDPPFDFSQGSYHELSNTLQLKWNPYYGEES